MLFLGIDTSCYTTSCAAVNEIGEIVFDHRIPLAVPEGKRGLRQSEMVFSHLKNLENLVGMCGKELKAVGYSVAPRPVEGSYMPVFQVSKSVGKAISACTGVKEFPMSHQQGHLGAAAYGLEIEGDMLAFHVSGGTTELLTVTFQNGVARQIKTIGGSKDISAGQVIDRLGVSLGMPFPCGPHVEQTARNGKNLEIKINVAKTWANFSGIESILERERKKGASPADLCFSAQIAIGKTLLGLLQNGAKETGFSRALFSGGVMCNKAIREYLTNQGEQELFFAKKEYASDNAVGVALQARALYNEEHKGE